MEQALTITELCDKAYKASQGKGFHSPTPTKMEKLALIMSELGEAVEELRKDVPDLYFAPSGKPEGLASELADAVIRIADMCGYHGIDLEGTIKLKMAYNATRAYKHGKTM